MRRREFIRFISGAVAAWPFTMRAQNPATPVIGFLHVGAAKSFEGIVAAFRQGLKDAGYTEHKTLRSNSAGPTVITIVFLRLSPNWFGIERR